MELIKVFLLDDHEVVRRGVASLLESTGKIKVTCEAGSVEEGRNRLKLVDVDVAVLDIQLPDGDGIQFCRELTETHPNISSVILTSYPDDDALVASVMAGAKAFVAKQIKGTSLIETVEKVAANMILITSQEVASAKMRLQKMQEDPKLESLTAQETRVLSLLAEGMSNRQIADHLFLAEKTVKNYVSNILVKLGFARRTEAAVWASHHELNPPD